VVLQRSGVGAVVTLSLVGGVTVNDVMASVQWV